MAKDRSDLDLDRELADLPPELRWREWMARVEAVLFAAAEPVGREVLARVVGRDCALDLLIEDIAADLAEVLQWSPMPPTPLRRLVTGSSTLA